ncbi:hypothetical protein IFM89_014284 [Coptis chinensis]|uniref:Phosphatase PP2A regulatory subunit A/Splicing factor 3B subunit 1-like HEAT repeat domain-containing protein n=1 Tax=Coptis chinensis TaxID=261450 RepID=A0A835LZH7_9MAGN|nr:hypothetical protein IFM89_014284 [Coptis chinensis]
MKMGKIKGCSSDDLVSPHIQEAARQDSSEEEDFQEEFKHTQLKLVNVLPSLSVSQDIYTIDYFIWDESWKSMESAGLLYLCEAQAKTPHINPDWIPHCLLTHVRYKWTNQHHIFYLPHLSALLLGGKERMEVLTPFLSEKNGDVPHLMFKNKLSISQLPQLAPVLGEKATREALIPFLAEKTTCDYAHVLLPALESLCTIEQPIVRNKAVESLCQIGEQMKENDLLTFFVPLVQKLADGESVAGRYSSCGLFHIAYWSAPENLKINYLNHMAVCVKMPPSCTPVNIFYFTVEESVCLFAANICTTVVNLLVQKDCLLEILSAIQNLSWNDFWRVRETVAEQFGDLCQAVSPFGENNWSGLVSAYGHLLQDKSEEVCIAATEQLGEVCRILNTRSTFDDVLPHIKKLSLDSSVRVRLALASGIMGLAPVLEKDLTNKHLIPTIKHLLQDETAEVRLEIISNIDNLTKVIGVNLLSGSLLVVSKENVVGGHGVFMPTIIKSIPLLAEQLGAGHYQMLHSLCDEALKDEVREDHVTRKAANLPRFAEQKALPRGKSSMTPVPNVPPPMHPPMNLQWPYGTLMMQPFSPPIPSPSLAPARLLLLRIICLKFILVTKSLIPTFEEAIAVDINESTDSSIDYEELVNQSPDFSENSSIALSDLTNSIVTNNFPSDFTPTSKLIDDNKQEEVLVGSSGIDPTSKKALDESVKIVIDSLYEFLKRD